MATPLTRIGFSLLDRAAPGLAAAGAEHRLVRIPKPPLQADRDRMIDPGEPFEVQYGDELLIRGQLWGGGPHVHLVHEWGGFHQQLGAQVGPLLSSGHQVVGHDALGHGESPAGRAGLHQARLVDLVDSFTAVAHAHGPVHGAIAHGTGALAVLGALRSGLTIGRLVLICPVLTVGSVVRRLAEDLGFSDATADALTDRVSADDWDPATVAGRLTDPPQLLVIADDADPDAPADETGELITGWPGARLFTTSGLGHHAPIRDGAVVSEVADFFAAAR